MAVIPSNRAKNITPSSIVATNTPNVGQIMSYNIDGTFTWVNNGGGSGSETNGYDVNFTHNNNSLLIGNIPSGTKITKVVLDIQEAFDDSNTVILVGDSVTHNRFMDTARSENDPTTIGKYSTEPDYSYVSNTNVNIYISGSNMQGSGVAIVYFEYVT